MIARRRPAGKVEHMQVGVITLFPGMFKALSAYGISSRAVRQGLLGLRYYNPRDYTSDRQRTVDARPYGGGPGMLRKTAPVSAAIQAARHGLAGPAGAPAPKVLMLSPQGQPLTQKTIEELARRESMILRCGRYEGIDERVLDSLVDEEYSLGDFVLSGGELAAMALLDALVRLQPGALGAAASAVEDSFAEGLLDHPHYTRPELFEGRKVPEVLLSGDHARIERWRLQQRLGATWRKRPDLLQKLQLSAEQGALLDEYIRNWRAENE